MDVRCPNCGTSFKVGDGTHGCVDVSRLHGTGFLMPETIRNENLTTEYGTVNKENNAEKMIKKEEKNTMMNNMSINFDLNTLAQMVAAQLKAEGTTNATPVAQPVAQPVATDNDTNHWAMNSQFKGTEICGYMYNPYMVRRFIQSQYMALVKKYDGNVHRGITREYTYAYSIKYVIDEIRKLAMLEQRDQIAFDERKICFPFADCRNILIEYVDTTLQYLDNKVQAWLSERNRRNGDVMSAKVKGRGYVKFGTAKEVLRNHKVAFTLVKSDAYTDIIFELNLLKNKLKDCYGYYNGGGYKNLEKIVSGFKVIELPEDTKKSKVFMDCFIRSGAYYTLKQMIMFDNATFRGKVGRKAVEELRKELNNGKEGYIFHAMLKEVLGIN